MSTNDSFNLRTRARRTCSFIFNWMDLKKNDQLELLHGIDSVTFQDDEAHLIASNIWKGLMSGSDHENSKSLVSFKQ